MITIGLGIQNKENTEKGEEDAQKPSKKRKYWGGGVQDARYQIGNRQNILIL